MAIDWDFIKTLEGVSLQGYVPAADQSRSGVTIATGVDLGQLSEAGLRGYPIPPDLIARLLPYVGLKTHAAVDVLAAHPLTITQAEADALDAADRAPIVSELRSNYGHATGGQPGFDDLPDAAQTVLASVAFQYGASLAARTPRFWQHATTGDWPGVVAELRSFGDAYPTRRHKEAAYLEARLGAA